MTRLLLISMFGCLALLAARQAWAETDAVESGRRSLTHRSSYPWYDAQQDELRRIELTPDQSDDDAGNRNSDWSAEPKPQPPQNSNPMVRGTSGGLGAVLQAGFWILLAVAIAAVIGLIAWAFVRNSPRQQAKAEAENLTSREVDRLEELPFAVKRPQSDLLGEARRHYEQGNFAEAIVYLFSYQLVELDKHQIIRLSKGKTNRQYLGESRRLPVVLPLLEQTMVAFEDVFFGHHTLDRARFESCWSRVAEFQRNLKGGVA
ncbi:MAG: hypothetical protein RIC55_15315 [Pirellulaceae bacterium]